MKLINCFESSSRRGVMGVMALLVFAAIILGFVVGQLWQHNSITTTQASDSLQSSMYSTFIGESTTTDSVQAVEPEQAKVKRSFLQQTEAAISQTFKDILGSKDSSAVEIDLNARNSSTVLLIAASSSIASTAVSQSRSNIAPVPTCSFNNTYGASHEIVFNEIAWMGSLSKANESASRRTTSQNEWLELKNVSGYDIPLSSWQILGNFAGKDTLKILFNKTDKIKAGELFVLERGDDNSAPGAAGKVYSGSLSNKGNWLKLFDDTCALVDEIDASAGWPAGNASTKQTLERDITNFGWHTSLSAGGTPGKQNSQPISLASTNFSPPPPGFSAAELPPSPPASGSPQPAPAGGSSPTPTPSPSPTPPSTGSGQADPNGLRIVIASVQITGGTNRTDNDFVKLYNPASASVDISNWKLRKRTQSGSESSIRVFPDGSSIAVGGYFIWANDSISASISANVSSSQTLAANNSVAIINNEGTVIDALAWGSGLTNPFIEGLAYPDSPAAAGQVLTRKFSDGSILDTNNNAQDFQIQ